jgi:hypothetical protein
MFSFNRLRRLNEKPGAGIPGSIDVDPGEWGSELGISREFMH